MTVWDKLTPSWLAGGKDDSTHKRIFCDCENTLINADLSINLAVLEFLKAAKESGYEIILVSDNMNLIQMPLEDCLGDYGLPCNHFGDVELKQDFVGYKAFLVLDDKPETMNHVDAQHVLDPSDPRLRQMTANLKACKSLGLSASV